MERWVLLRKGADFEAIGKKYQISPRLACLIRNRDVVGDEQIQQYLYGELSDISDPFLMKGVKEGVEILKQKVQEGKTIRIISDYDVDGVVSNYILWKAIHDLGGKIDFQIPDRMKDGYGINENIIEKAVEDQIDTILTCDNGIAAADAVAYGKEHGLTMIITDHHDVPFDTDEAGVRKEVLPPADVVINPKQEACNYPYPLLCGAGVAFQFMRAFYQAMEEDESQLEELLSMLAIATVCDVVDLTGENRIFVKEGLRRIKDTQNIGLKALLNVHDLMDKQIQSYALGFIVGPCINASGRLESAEKALNLFLEEDEEKAKQTAEELKELNDLRKTMTENGVKEALGQAFEYEAKGDKVLVLYLPECHESIAGIIAGRIKDRLNHPAFVLTDAKEGIKGSGRSIEGYSMFEEMMKVKEVFTKFGGHPMAAGCSLEKEKLQEFRKKINENCTLEKKDFAKKVQIDIDMPVDYITMDLIHQLSVFRAILGKMKNKKLHILDCSCSNRLFFVCIAVFGCGEDIKGIRDMRFGIDIRGGVEAVFEPSGLKKKLTAEQLEMAREVIETRLDSQNILDREVTVDEKAGDVIVRFPWKSDEKNFDPETAIQELGEMAELTFRGPDNTVYIKGSDVSRSQVAVDQQKNYVVELEFSSEGAKKFADATEKLVGQQMGIYMDDDLISNPTVNAKITGGKAEITGMSSKEEAQSLSDKINSGSLPFSMKTTNYSTISPTLGGKALNAMALAAEIAMALICLFMIIWYRLPGVISCLTLTFQIALQILVISVPQYTITLPGIAGLILSAGMAVDANIIISERISEELKKRKFRQKCS